MHLKFRIAIINLTNKKKITMEQSKSKKQWYVVKSAFRWLGFSFTEIILTVLNLIFIFSIIYYCWYSFGSVQRIEPEEQTISIKKVDGFYLIQGKEYNRYVEKTFPDCKLKFYNITLELKKGDVYHNNKKVTEKVTIDYVGGGFRVYYLNRSYPLTTITNIDGTYELFKNHFEGGKNMYTKNGRFYIDKDERHTIRNFFLLICALVIIYFGRKIIAEIAGNLFEKELKITSNVFWSIIETIQKAFSKKKENDKKD